MNPIAVIIFASVFIFIFGDIFAAAAEMLYEEAEALYEKAIKPKPFKGVDNVWTRKIETLNTPRAIRKIK